ncbi:MAG: CarD family transcriptional regulator [Clostridium butyricum]|nr:CarD family transcriptional regulator [Clostridium butyricum]
MLQFKEGDKVVYPNQGVGIIEYIEEKEFNGKLEKYYKIYLTNNKMKVLLPFSRVEKSHMRLISDPDYLDYKLDHANDYIDKAEKLSKINYKERNELYNIKIKSGTVEDYLELIYNLTKMKMKHDLNYMEKTMLRTAKRILADEIAQSKHMDFDEAYDKLDKLIIQ